MNIPERGSFNKNNAPPIREYDENYDPFANKKFRFVDTRKKSTEAESSSSSSDEDEIIQSPMKNYKKEIDELDPDINSIIEEESNEDEEKSISDNDEYMSNEESDIPLTESQMTESQFSIGMEEKDTSHTDNKVFEKS